MRQKKLKYVNIDLMKKFGVITEPKEIKVNKDELFLEIGSGKGLFITSLAKDNPDKLFIAMERNINVCYRIVEKKEELDLNNLIIILGDAKDLLTYFPNKNIDKLYLNFSDPWPKKRHHKRRLTYPFMLELYKKILKENGIVQFRTDHLSFFEDSVEYFEQHFNIFELDYNLKLGKYYTEYELRKRKKSNIYQLKASVKNE